MTPDHGTTRCPRRPRGTVGRWLAVTGVAMILGTLMAGCGGDDAAVRPPSTTAAPNAPTAGNNGECPLTTEDVSAVVGVAVTDLGSCGWTSESVDVFYSEFPPSLFSTYRQQAEDGSDVVAVEGLGDEAFAVVNGELHVLTGEFAFTIFVGPGITDPDLDLDAAKRDLAALIVGRQS